MEKQVEQLLESLSPNEQAILPHLKEKSFTSLLEKSGLDETSALRALEFLSNKKLLTLKREKEKIVSLDVNGILYRNKGLPERRLINVLAEKAPLSLEEAQKESKLNDNEFKAALGALKGKALIELKNARVLLQGKKQEISNKSSEEQFLEALPLELGSLTPEQKFAFEKLKKRKKIIFIKEEREISVELTKLGSEMLSQDISKIKSDMIEQVTPEIIKSEKWRGKKFRRYDITSSVPKIFGGKRHFVNQAVEYGRKVWLEMGFKEMSSSLLQTGFWNFDALFTAQDHPVREIQDTFYIKDKTGRLPDKKIVEQVKLAHEKGISGSRGWQYEWKEQEAQRVILRTHTTCLSAHTLASLRGLKTKDKRSKFFAIGKCFRNETIDWSHGFEFNQTEGIVVDKDANFKNLLGYLKEFFKKMGFEDIKFYPSYFPYTEPSVEIYGYLKEKKAWIEIGGAGIFRPEVVVPLLGEYVPVLAWGPGFDRILMDYYKIKDLRDLYSNDLTKLREMKFWLK